MSKRILRVLLAPLLSLWPLLFVYDFAVWIKTGKFNDSGRCFLCYIAFGKWEELI